MNLIDDEILRPWSPPTYRVDEKGKVVGAKPGEPNNWGRWGDDDQRGTLNLLTPERVSRAATLIQDGRSFSLGLPMGHGAPYPGSRGAPLHGFHATSGDWILGDPGRYSLQASDDFVVMSLQSLTQLDGLSHVAAGDVMYNGFWAGLVTAASGARRLGIHHLASGISGRGVLLDIARAEGSDICSGAITAQSLDAAAAEQGVAIESGDIILLRTGVLGHWLRDPAEAGLRSTVGVDESTIPWLARNDISLLAADNSAVELVVGLPDHPDIPFHRRAICDLGLLLGEFLMLDELAEACYAAGRYEFFFCAQPLPMVNAVGSPLNPLAIL